MKCILNITKNKGHLLPKVPDFDVLSVDPKQTATILKERLTAVGLTKIKVKK